MISLFQPIQPDRTNISTTAFFYFKNWNQRFWKPLNEYFLGFGSKSTWNFYLLKLWNCRFSLFAKHVPRSIFMLSFSKLVFILCIVTNPKFIGLKKWNEAENNLNNLRILLKLEWKCNKTRIWFIRLGLSLGCARI